MNFRAQRFVLAVAFGLTLTVSASAQAQDDRVFDPEELSTQPAVESVQQAARVIRESYPQRMFDRGIGGRVLLMIVIGVDGRVEADDVTVVSADPPGLGRAASQAVTRVRFTPGEVDGRAVRTAIVFPVVYRAN